MAAVAPQPHHFGQYPHPGPFPPYNPAHRRNDFPPPPVNHAPVGQYPRPEPFPPVNSRTNFPQTNHAPFGQYPRPEPFPSVNSRNNFPQTNHAPFGQYPPTGPLPDHRHRHDRPDHTRPGQRNKRVAFITPSGGYYSTSTSPTTPTRPQPVGQNGGPHRSRRVWSRLLNRFRQERPAPRAEAYTRPVIPTIPQSQPSALGREQQVQQLLSLLLPHVPAAEPMIRPLVNHIHDSRVLQRLIDTLNRPLTQQQFLQIQDSFAVPRDEQEEIIGVLNNPGDPNIPTMVAQFREFVELISGRPMPAPDQAPASTGGAFSRLGRLVPSILRNSSRRNQSQSASPHTIPAAFAPEPAPAQLSTEQQNRTERFSIHELRESQFRHFIVGPFTCTVCETDIPVNPTRGADPQLGTNLHLRCPNPTCLAVFCRGCRRNVTGCQPNCNARHACNLKSCCADVRAMAVFEYLSVFDEDYLTRVRNFHHGAADAHTNANRLSFLEHAFDPANRRDPRFRGFISVLKRTLKYVCFWLEPSVPENVVCDTVLHMLAASFLLEAVRAFLSRGIQTLAQFRTRGYLIHRIVDLLFTLNRTRSGPFYDLVGSSPVIIDQSPGLRCLIWAPESVWEGHFSVGGDPTLLEYMRGLWTHLENEVGTESLRGVANEFDARLYERGHDVSLLQRA